MFTQTQTFFLPPCIHHLQLTLPTSSSTHTLRLSNVSLQLRVGRCQSDVPIKMEMMSSHEPAGVFTRAGAGIKCYTLTFSISKQTTSCDNKPLIHLLHCYCLIREWIICFSQLKKNKTKKTFAIVAFVTVYILKITAAKEDFCQQFINFQMWSCLHQKRTYNQIKLRKTKRLRETGCGYLRKEPLFVLMFSYHMKGGCIPLNVSIRDVLGAADGHFTFPSPSRFVTFQRTSNISKGEHTCFIRVASSRIRSFKLFDVALCC